MANFNGKPLPMLVHPQFDPVALHLGPLAIRWYGLMYLLAFILVLVLGRARIRSQPASGWTFKELDDVLFYGVLGVVVGGRLGYVLFYKPGYYLADPFSTGETGALALLVGLKVALLRIVSVWEGGMSFHGGFLGVLLAMALFSRRSGKPWLAITDFIAPLVPLGLGAGRIGNFINGELWGRPTDMPWGMVFPLHDKLARHPSQLYEFLLEGVALFFLLWFYSARRRPAGAVSALFLIGYGAFRFLVEFTREPDDFLGLLALGLTMGQWLSLPMIVAGIALLIWARRKEYRENPLRRLAR
jgi:phosphatidylglycerol:prolipoprotein diacylglycerol transferase